MIELNCKVCGKAFKVVPIRKNAKCCSKKCAGILARGRINYWLIGKKSGEKKSNKKVKCQICNKTFEVLICRNPKYCSINCRNIALKKRDNHWSKGVIPWNKGLTKETNEKIKIMGEKISKKLKGRVSPMKNKHHNEKTKKKMTKSHKDKKRTEESKKKGSETRKRLYKEGKITPYWLNKHRTEESKKKESETLKQLYKEGKIKLNNKKGWHHTKEAIQKISEKQKIRWADNDYRKKITEAILKGLFKRPTSYEQKIIDLCKEHSLSFKYVGNGQVIINYVNPDFISTNGDKLIIETYCKHWHKPDYEKTRSEIFAKFGYKTLFLNDEDLCCKNWEQKCLQKIREFETECGYLA